MAQWADCMDALGAGLKFLQDLVELAAGDFIAVNKGRRQGNVGAGQRGGQNYSAIIAVQRAVD